MGAHIIPGPGQARRGAGGGGGGGGGGAEGAGAARLGSSGEIKMRLEEGAGPLS